MKTAMLAIIQKDFRGVTSNKRLLTALLVVPLALTIIMPSIFVLAIHFTPDDRTFKAPGPLAPGGTDRQFGAFGGGADL